MKRGILIAYLLLVTLILQHEYPFSWDSAEFVNNAFNGWYAHPPGAPLYSIVGALISLRFIALMSSIGVIISFYYISKQVTDSTTPVYLLVTAPLFLMNYNWIEVYMPALFLLMLSVQLFLEWTRSLNTNQLGVSAILLGIAIGVYPSAIFFTIFFITYILLMPPKTLFWHPLIPLMIFLPTVLIIAFVAYTPIMYEVGGVEEGIGWITSIAGEVFGEPFDPIRTVKRIAVGGLIAGAGSLFALPFIFKRDRAMIPYAVTVLIYAIFIFGGSQHFQEHLLLPVPFIALIGGFYLSKSMFKYLVIPLLLVGGVFSALVVGSVYEFRDTTLNQQFSMIDYLPSDSVVIDLASYEHTNHFMGEHYNIYALDDLGTPYDLHYKGAYGTTDKLWGYEYTTIENQLQEKKLVYILNTAFLASGSREEIELDYRLVEASMSPLPQGNDFLWKIIRKPVSMRFENITLYHLEYYPDFTYIHDSGCQFEIHDFFAQPTEPQATFFDRENGCRDGGMEVLNTRYCFNKCAGEELVCWIYGNNLMCGLK